jgi:hypothetical protein
VSDKPAMAYRLDQGLSDREVFLVGQIIVEWGSLEHEVFSQVLDTFPSDQSTSLPPAMNNLRFSEVLKLWKERVVDQSQAEHKDVLLRAYDEILILKPFREALVHGMWHWAQADLSRISTTRVRKNEVIATHFSADDLAEIDSRIGSVNFVLRFPGGPADLARVAVEQPSVGRRFLASIRQNRVAKDWLSTLPGPEVDEPNSDA